MIKYAQDRHFGKNIVPFGGPGFVGIDGDFGTDEAALGNFVADFFRTRLDSMIWLPFFLARS